MRLPIQKKLYKRGILMEVNFVAGAFLLIQPQGLIHSIIIAVATASL